MWEVWQREVGRPKVRGAVPQQQPAGTTWSKALATTRPLVDLSCKDSSCHRAMLVFTPTPKPGACTFPPGRFKRTLARRVSLGHQSVSSSFSIRSDGTQCFCAIPLPSPPGDWTPQATRWDSPSVTKNIRDLVGSGTQSPQLWATTSSSEAAGLQGWLFASGCPLQDLFTQHS